MVVIVAIIIISLLLVLLLLVASIKIGTTTWRILLDYSYNKEVATIVGIIKLLLLL